MVCVGGVTLHCGGVNLLVRISSTRTTVCITCMTEMEVVKVVHS